MLVVLQLVHSLQPSVRTLQTSTTTVQSGTGGLNLNTAGTAVITANRPVVVTPTALPGGNTAGMIAVDSAASNTLKYNNGAGWVTVANSSAVSGTTGYLSRFTGTGTVGNSAMFENSGNIGIGTTSAARLLQVAGAMRLSPVTTPASPSAGDMFIDSAASNVLKYYNGSGWVTPSSATSSGTLGMIQFADGSGGFSSTGGFNYDTTFDTFRISNTAAPATGQTRLQISAPATGSEIRAFNSTTGTTATDGLSLATSSSDVRFMNFESGKMFFGTAGADRLTIDASGNLGLGTTSPNATYPMTVQSSGANSFVYSLNGSVGTTFGSNSSAGVLTTTSNNPLNLGTNASTRMTILATGEVGVGTTSPARMFQVAGAARLSPTTTPASPAAGDVFIDSGASNSLKYHNGSGWSRSATAISVARVRTTESRNSLAQIQLLIRS